MKKLIVFVAAVAFTFSLLGCATKNKVINQGTPSTTKKGTSSTTNKGTSSTTGKKVAYKNGVYDVLHKSTKPGYEEAVVTIKNDKIKNIVLKRLGDDKKELNYAIWDGKHDGYPNLKKFRVDLAKAMLAKQSPDVNVISGATQSSNGWKAAVSSALAKAQ